MVKLPLQVDKTSERNIDKMTFGERLKILMAEQNLTQRQLSKKLNIAASTLNGYANDYREPDFHTLKKIAAYFGVSIDYLMDYSIPRENSADLSSDPKAQRLLGLYQLLDTEQRAFLIEQAQLLVKYARMANHKCDTK